VSDLSQQDLCGRRTTLEHTHDRENFDTDGHILDAGIAIPICPEAAAIGETTDTRNGAAKPQSEQPWPPAWHRQASQQPALDQNSAKVFRI
jgi:hypothetical protein